MRPRRPRRRRRRGARPAARDGHPGAVRIIGARPRRRLARLAPATDAVLVGAGDIATCGGDDDSATAALVEGIPGAVFTAGDNAYENGSAKDFRDCYDPTWGAFKDRTRPTAGNHDWQTKDLAGYLGYFGAAAGTERHELVLVRPRRVARHRPRLGLLERGRLRRGLGPGSMAGGGPEGVDAAVHARDLAPPAVQLRVPRQRPLGRAVLAGPLRGRRRSHRQRPRPRLRAVRAAGSERARGPRARHPRVRRRDGRRRIASVRDQLARTASCARPGSFGIIRLDLHHGSYDWRFIPTSGDFSDSGIDALPLTYRSGP